MGTWGHFFFTSPLLSGERRQLPDFSACRREWAGSKPAGAEAPVLAGKPQRGMGRTRRVPPTNGEGRSRMRLAGHWQSDCSSSLSPLFLSLSTPFTLSWPSPTLSCGPLPSPSLCHLSYSLLFHLYLPLLSVLLMWP